MGGETDDDLGQSVGFEGEEVGSDEVGREYADEGDDDCRRRLGEDELGG